jgi:heptosyltransferase-2
MTLPALEAIRECFPEKTVTVLAKPWVSPLFENHPMVDEVLSIGKERGFFLSLVEIFKVASQIRRSKFDLAILFQNAFEAALIAYLAGIKYRVGYKTDHRGFLLSHPIIKDDKNDSHQVEYYLSLVRAMGCKAKSKDPELYVSKEYDTNTFSDFFGGGIARNDLILGLGPGASFGPAKRWPPDRFASLADMAVEKWNAKVFIFGSKAEKDICNQVSRRMNYSSINLCGETELEEAMALIKRCNMFVSNDSGLMHMAAALSVPLVAVFGSTDPVATGPRGSNTRIVRHQVDCSPCLQRKCPTDYRCMLSISPEDVWNEMSNLKDGMGKI